MSRRYNRLPSISNVAPGSTATLEIPVTTTYDRIFFEISGVTKAQITGIELRLNGKPFQQFRNAVMVDDLNQYYDRGTAENVVDFWFIRPEMDNIDLRRMTAIGTADVGTFDIKFDIAEGAENPRIVAYAVRSLQSKLGAITKVKNFPTSAATAGVKDIDNIPKEGRFAGVHFFSRTEGLTVTGIDVEADSRRIYELSKSLGEKVQSDAGRNPLKDKATSVDFVTEGNPLNALAVTQIGDLRFKPELSAPGALDVVVEYLSGYEGI